MPGERELDGGRVDLQGAAWRGRRRRPSRRSRGPRPRPGARARGDRAAVEEDAERVAAAAVGGGEDAQRVQASWRHARHDLPSRPAPLCCSPMPTRVPPEIFKAYDVRGLYGEQIDGDVAEQVGRAFARVLAGLRGKQTGELRVGLGRDMRLSAPELAGALPRGHGGRGRARARRRDGRHGDALLPRRLARARRRADVHRLAQPEGLHGRQAGARGRAGAVRRHGHRRDPRAGRPPACRAPTAAPRQRRGGRRRAGLPRARARRSSTRRRSGRSRSCSTAATGWPGRWSARCSSSSRASSSCPATGSPTASSPTTSPTRSCPRTAAS